MTRVVAVFTVLFVGMTWIIEYFHLPYPDEIWLISGIVAALIVYWIRPNAEEGYLEFTGPILLLVLGAYLIAVKVPKLLSGLINYRLAGLLCLAFYVGCCWIIIKQRSKLRKRT